MAIKETGRKCLGCGEVLDRVTRITRLGEEVPDDATHISICWLCGYVQAFTDDGFRNLTGEEIIDIAGNPDVVLANSIRGPMRELVQQHDRLTKAEFQAKLLVIAKAVIAAHRARQGRP